MNPRLQACIARGLALVAATLGLAACNNSPYADGAAATNTLFYSFDERSPRYLDPTASYTNPEAAYTYQIYEPLYGYHYLKRPYSLIPGLATAVPKAQPQADGSIVYAFELRAGALFQDDPCFALGSAGRRTREISADDVAFELMRVPSACSISNNQCAAAPGDPVFAQAQSAVHLANIGWTVTGIGLAAAIGGTIWYFTGAHEDAKERLAVTPWAAPNSGGFAVGGAW